MDDETGPGDAGVHVGERLRVGGECGVHELDGRRPGELHILREEEARGVVLSEVAQDEVALAEDLADEGVVIAGGEGVGDRGIGDRGQGCVIRLRRALWAIRGVCTARWALGQLL